MDNATWHRRKATNWHHWQPKYLPAYSPDLNPIERIWLTMKARWFNNYACKNEHQLSRKVLKEYCGALTPFYITLALYHIKGYDRSHRNLCKINRAN